MKDKTLSILLLIETVIVSILFVQMYFQDKSIQKYKDFVNSIDTTTLTIVEKDTVYQTKTYTDSTPKYITKWRTKTDTLYRQNDSVQHLVSLKGKTYTNEIVDDKDTIEYQVHISGFDVDTQDYPRLDSINLILRHFLSQTNTTNTKVVKVPQERSKWRLSPSIGIGYGLVNKQSDVFLGVTIGYDIFGK